MAVLLPCRSCRRANCPVDATSKTLTAAKMLGDVTILCASAGCSGAAEAAAKLDGVTKVLCADDAAYGHDLAEPVAD